MKLGFKHSVLVRAAAALLAVAAPVLSGCNKTDFAKEQADRIAEYKVKDDALIQAYLTRKGITAGDGVNQYVRLSEEGNDGLYLVKLSDGPSTNALITAGKQVDITYVGRYLRENNENVVFDNSTDRRVPCGCYSLTVGAGQVIKGWDQGLLKMRKGDRRLLLVPSYLAYGRNGSVDPVTRAVTIPGDEPLLFDMTVLEVR